ncbi:MAG: hypothetical protein K9G64_06275 [Bacteroidia bacterium]|nr:hypothetical protein [Bacteroidia bacterium]
MKKLIKLSIVIAFSIIANFAVAQKSPEEKTKIMLKKLNEKLALNNDQQQKLNDIFITHYNMMRDIRFQFKNEDKELGKKTAKEQWSRTDQQVTMILNDVQRTKYNEAKIKMLKKTMNKKNKNVNGDLKNAKNQKPIEVDVDEPLDEEAF